MIWNDQHRAAMPAFLGGFDWSSTARPDLSASPVDFALMFQAGEREMSHCGAALLQSILITSETVQNCFLGRPANHNKMLV